MLGLAGGPGAGQEITRTTPIDDLPRPGYEPRTIRTNGFIIAPAVDIGVRYDNNIFATPSAERSDTIFRLSPSVVARKETASSLLYGRAYGDLYRYADNPRENMTAFGGKIDYRRTLGRQSVSGKLAYDRAFERRSDPEAIFGQSRRPARIDVMSGELEFAHQGGRIGIAAAVGAIRLNYLALEDADRDMVTYTARLKGSVNLSQRVAVFAQPFFNYRDPRLRFDRFGIDRTTRTYGVTSGLSVDIADRLTGEVGVGLFRADPRDPSLRAYTGVAASGQMTWRPRTRTAISLDLFRGDVATIRNGAMGRIDTRFNINIDQEARHNLILRGSAGYRKVQYRGGSNVDQHYLSAEASALYLLNRHMSLELGGVRTKRKSDNALEEFGKWQAFAKLGLRY